MKKDNISSLITTLSMHNEWYAGNELASYLHMTQRTIRNYVREINEGTEDPLILSCKKGYKLNRNSKNPLFFLKSQNDLDTPEKRQAFILRELSFRDTVSFSEPLSVEGLAERLMVSYRTIEVDLEAIRTYLKEFSLSLHLKNDHLSISGSETNKRRLIADSIIKRLKDDILTNRSLAAICPTVDIEDLSVSLRSFISHHDMYIDNHRIKSLLLHIVVQILRIENTHLTRTEDIQIPNIQKRKEYLIAQEIGDYFYRKNTVCFSWGELNYLALLIICTCNDTKAQFFQNDPVYQMVEESVSHLKNHTGIDYSKEYFIHVLTDFFYRLEISCHYGIEVINPLISSIRNSSPIVQDYAAWIMSKFSKELNISVSKEKLTYLTMLLIAYQEKYGTKQPLIRCCLISPEYYMMNESLIRKIKSRFHEQIRLDNVLSNYESMPDSDLYLSVSPSKNRKHIVNISPLLNSDDCKAIQNEIEQIEKERRCRNFELFLRSYSKEEFFEKNTDIQNREQIISYISKRLCESSCVSSSFQNSVLIREKADSTSFFNLIAVPHASAECVYHNSIYIILNEKPISWGDRKINLVVLAAMERELNDDFEVFYETLVNLFRDRKIIKRLLEASDYTAFLDSLTALVNM